MVQYKYQFVNNKKHINKFVLIGIIILIILLGLVSCGRDNNEESINHVNLSKNLTFHQIESPSLNDLLYKQFHLSPNIDKYHQFLDNYDLFTSGKVSFCSLNHSSSDADNTHSYVANTHDSFAIFGIYNKANKGTGQYVNYKFNNRQHLLTLSSKHYKNSLLSITYKLVKIKRYNASWLSSDWTPRIKYIFKPIIIQKYNQPIQYVHNGIPKSKYLSITVLHHINNVLIYRQKAKPTKNQQNLPY